MADNTVIVTSTKEELLSYRGLKILCTAFQTNTTALLETCSSPLSSLYSLKIQNNESINAYTATTILKSISLLSPSKTSSNLEQSCIIDSWLAFIQHNIETPHKAFLTSKNDTMKKDLMNGLQRMNNQLTYKTYFVGDEITLVDISLCCLLNDLSFEWKTSLEHLSRLHDTIIHQSFFLQAQSKLTELKSSGSISTSSASFSDALNYHGIPPPVQKRLFTRSRIRVKEAADYLNQTITVSGWTRAIRNANKGQLLFVGLNDGSCFNTLQCVLDIATLDNFDECKNCGGVGSSFELTGVIIASEGKGQDVEMQVSKAILLGAVYGGDPTDASQIGGTYYPLSKKEHSLEYLREVAHLRARARIHSSIMRIRHNMAFATHQFFNSMGFLYIHTPIITCADCEGAGEQFGVTTLFGTDVEKTDIKLPYYEEVKEEPNTQESKEETETATTAPPAEEKKISKQEMKRLKKKAEKEKKAAEKASKKVAPIKHVHVEKKTPGAINYAQDFFSRRANLTVSGQLNVETHACALSDVYTFGPTFRAENSHTARHLAEFWMIEPEVSFCDLDRVLDLAEDYLKYCVEFALKRSREDLEFLEGFAESGLITRLEKVLEKPFMRITYTKAIEILQEAVDSKKVTFEEKPEWGIDLPTEMERYICETVYNQPVAITHYPKQIKAFYMKVNEDDKTVAAADVLVPKIGEIIGGSQREERYDKLKERCIETGLDPAAVWWYLDLRKYGTVKHAGFGLGFERLILFVTGMDNIRDVIPFPRWPGNAEF